MNCIVFLKLIINNEKDNKFSRDGSNMMIENFSISPKSSGGRN